MPVADWPDTLLKKIYRVKLRHATGHEIHQIKPARRAASQRRRRDIFVAPKLKLNPAPAGRDLLLTTHPHIGDQTRYRITTTRHW